MTTDHPTSAGGVCPRHQWNMMPPATSVRAGCSTVGGAGIEVSAHSNVHSKVVIGPVGNRYPDPHGGCRSRRSPRVRFIFGGDGMMSDYHKSWMTLRRMCSVSRRRRYVVVAPSGQVACQGNTSVFDVSRLDRTGNPTPVLSRHHRRNLARVAESTVHERSLRDQLFAVCSESPIRTERIDSLTVSHGAMRHRP